MAITLTIHYYILNLLTVDIMKGKRTMFEYCKYILKAVHFDEKLFIKEYRKSLLWLKPIEARELKRWIKTEFQSSKRLLNIE